MKTEAIQPREAQLPRIVRTNLLPILLGFLFIGGTLFFSASQFPNSIKFREFGVNDVTQLLTVLALISLFLERSLEVFINTWRGPTEERLNTAIQNAERVMKEIKETQRTKVEKSQQLMQTTEAVGSHNPTSVTAAVEVKKIAEGPEQMTPEFVAKLNELEAYRQRRATFKSETKKYALWTALVFGVLISGVGVRSLDALVEPIAQNAIASNTNQVLLFRMLDMVLTSGLIAGGSDGIHKVTQLFSTYFEESRNNIRDRAASG